jgi:hypothetical protein
VIDSSFLSGFAFTILHWPRACVAKQSCRQRDFFLSLFLYCTSIKPICATSLQRGHHKAGDADSIVGTSSDGDFEDGSIDNSMSDISNDASDDDLNLDSSPAPVVREQL